MKPIAVLYATREGHTRHIALYVAAALQKRGLAAIASNLAGREVASDLSRFAGLMVASPVHMGRHAPETARFVKEHLAHLKRLPTAFLSVTLSEAGAERAEATPEERAKFAADVRKVNDLFLQATCWRPEYLINVAGALLYRQYNILLRLVMKRIARKAGGSPNTSQNHIYTDWVALDRFVAAFAQHVVRRAAAESSSVENATAS